MASVEEIAILDFGSQYTQLIARRVRELGVFSRVLPGETPAEELASPCIKGIILSGGPASVAEGTLCDPELLDLGRPLLGICYGMHLLNTLGGGRVRHVGRGEYGSQKISVHSEGLFRGMEAEQTVWMSHGDSVDHLSEVFRVTARSSDGLVAAIRHVKRPIFGVQFHLEVTHTLQGRQMLDNFLALCTERRDWDAGHCIESIEQKIRDQVGDARVVSLVSGGVDSTVATRLCQEALGRDRVIPLHIDPGLMREGESARVRELLGLETIVDASAEFLSALRGVSDPECKRRIIGELFIGVVERELERRSGEAPFFCQGTLYTDLIESGQGCGKAAAVIKSHHNVNPPLVQRLRAEGRLVEPNCEMFKDEVRSVGAALGLPEVLLRRHPFPGPGLAIRILGDVTQARLELLRRADAIFLEELRGAGLYDCVWQAFAVLLPVTAVGVQGDKRTEGEVIVLRAVESVDGMTARAVDLPHAFVTRVATRIANEVPGIGRVVYDVTHKPPSTIEWE